MGAPRMGAPGMGAPKAAKQELPSLAEAALMPMRCSCCLAGPLPQHSFLGLSLTCPPNLELHPKTSFVCAHQSTYPQIGSRPACPTELWVSSWQVRTAPGPSSPGPGTGARASCCYASMAQHGPDRRRPPREVSRRAGPQVPSRGQDECGNQTHPGPTSPC